MSGCGRAGRTARWRTSEPPRWTIRRTVAILTASLVLLVVAAVPAWAGASIAPAEVEADVDRALALTVTEPEDEEYGDTARVALAAPTGFSDLACGQPTLGWECAVGEDGTRLTFTRTWRVALVEDREFRFSVHTAAVNGQHAFRVTQADGPPSEEDPPATVTSRPTVTVTGGRDPEPEPTPPADDGGAQDDGGSQTDTGGSTASGDQSGGTGQDAGTADGDDDTGQDTEAGDTASGDRSTSEGSTAPRRTQGRTSATTLEVTPGQPSDDTPDVAAPNVADDPAIAPPDDGPDDSTDSAAAAATGTQASGDPGGGMPWQQWVGAAMLLVGGALVANRRWDLAGRLRGLEPLERLRRWRSR